MKHVSLGGLDVSRIGRCLAALHRQVGRRCHSFVWRARAGWGPAKGLHVVDRYADCSGSMDVRLLGSIPLVRADGEDTVRSGAGRAALEAATWAPAALLPDRGIAWRAESDTLIVAS